MIATAWTIIAIVLGVAGALFFLGYALLMIGSFVGWILERFGWIGPTRARRAREEGRAPERVGYPRDLLDLGEMWWFVVLVGLAVVTVVLQQTS
ncbi:hypothetical protein [Candidatus Solirubrobacter pratensis]|uniref:hypothetical protein n=1 Tax=Candidatus Solirubrobacter pratensis TaxID=1298857 RepID=UPI000489EF10|nr:hypothetical protein [Candidatus Solirubrobacter pratensis]